LAQLTQDYANISDRVHMQERLQKLLSQWGIASRRQAESIILEGRVTVNGAPAHLGHKADPDVDIVRVDGKRLGQVNRPELSYFLLNKPRGVVSTCDDPQNRRTVLDLLPVSLRQQSGIHPVGRLDTDSSGALLLTNDGQLTYGLTHPRHQIPKCYRVKVQGLLTADCLKQWRQGVMLAGKKTLPARVQVVRIWANQTLLEVTMREGRNRQIRRVAEALGCCVVTLHRTAIGPIQLKGLERGAYRALTLDEIRALKATITGADQPTLVC
jgi:pseudouridine synthase